jgi:hypothetical protein
VPLSAAPRISKEHNCAGLIAMEATGIKGVTRDEATTGESHRRFDYLRSVGEFQ